ncbi:MAG TPA: hypothetical protein VGR13_07065 [Actinomycetota bacterium]|jgi:hypothetical protein|nr:hypothetical protein [Actinomycetota bacterium]
MTQKNVAVLFGGLALLAAVAGVVNLMKGWSGSQVLGTIFVLMAIAWGAFAVLLWRRHQRGSPPPW